MSPPVTPNEITCGLQILAEGKRPVVDIIAVHGLNSSPDTCWRSKKTDHVWLRDWLPYDIPNARIMTFGYNSRVFKDPSTAGIRDHALSLLSDLKDERQRSRTQKRPIIFVCHSLGGIIVKQALVNAAIEKRYNTIKTATGGIIFLGTPHRGSDAAAWGKLIANIGKTTIHSSTTLLKTLQKNSQELHALSQDFSHMQNHYMIANFYEQKASKVGLGSVMVVDKFSATMGIQGEIVDPMDCDHHGLPRFNEEEDLGYKKVRARLQEFTKKVPGVVNMRFFWAKFKIGS